MCRLLPKLFIWLCCICLKVTAQPTVAFTADEGALNLKPYFYIVEGNNYTPEILLHRPQLFVPLNNFKHKKNDNTFWLKTLLAVKKETDAIIFFRHLTHTELFLVDNSGQIILHRKAGAFRPVNEIHDEDSRFHFSVRLHPDIKYTLFIKSTHTKKYPPSFDFQIQEKYRFIKSKHQRELLDLWLQGASGLLIIYIILSWFSTRYRPFLWLTVFSLGFNLYDISMNRYLTDWFFSSNPHYGWLLVLCFLHIGLIGLFLLIIDSWNIKMKHPGLYKNGRVLIIGIIALSVVSFGINYYDTNYRLSTYINICFSIFPLLYSISALYLLWKKLDKQELFLAYGLMLYITGTLFFNIHIILWGEKLYLIAPIISKTVSICVTMLFLMGLNARLRQNEKDKMRYLGELNSLQQYQNEILEENVAQRTAELEQRNRSIETLMNELNHRVKNNLQLLYSLNSLQLPNASDVQTANLIKDNIARIKAMMLVNEGLNHNQIDEEKNIFLYDFVTEIINHSKKMFNSERKVDFNVEIDKQLILDSRTNLSLGIILSELITNSYKHAFTLQPAPYIYIGVSISGSNWYMKYSDNGTGILVYKNHSLGLSLINDLTRQLKGTVEMVNDNGLVYLFNFPVIS